MNIRCPGCQNPLSLPGGHARVQCPYCGTIINAGGGSAGPTLSVNSRGGSSSGGHSRGRSKGSNAQMLAVVAALVVLIGAGIIVGVGMTRMKPGDRTAVNEATPKPEALLKAQEAIAKHYRTDVTFEEKPNLRSIGENEWTVDSHLRYRTPAGTLLRESYYARVRRDENNHWLVEDVRLAGRPITADVPLPANPKGANDPPIVVTPEVPRDDRSVGRAVRTLASVIDESAKTRNTLVVWLFDSSPSATKLRDDMIGGMEDVYATLRKRQSAKLVPAKGDAKAAAKEGGQDANTAAGELKLQVAVTAFDEDARVITESPISDDNQFREALTKIGEGKGGREKPFAAMQAALDKFGDFAKQGGRLQFVVVTDEAGDDDIKAIDSTITALKKAGVQVYVVGKEAPLGLHAWPKESSFGGAANDGPDPLHQGPESAFADRINLQFWQSSFTDKMFEIPSGFGPFQLSRVCKLTDGAFLVCEDGGGGGWSGWGGGRNPNLSFDAKTRGRYEPQYLTTEELTKQEAGNAALRALKAVSQIPEFEVVKVLQFEFVAGNEVQLKNALDAAQKGVAKTEPKLSEMYDLLKPGIADAKKLTVPRQQAAFDLAIGRVLAMQARVEGYNAMLANLKGGRRFKNAGSNVWVLQASDTSGAGSKYEGYMKEARKYLEGIVKNHPNTPWAQLAQRELEAKMGWEWGER